MTTVPLNNRAMAFDRDCSDFDENRGIAGRSTFTVWYTVYVCEPHVLHLWTYVSVDVTFRKDQLPSSPTIPSTVACNPCVINYNPVLDDNNNRDAPFTHATAMHEAGHALGLMNRVSFVSDWEYYIREHSTIQDSVINYDDSVPTDWAPVYLTTCVMA